MKLEEAVRNLICKNKISTQTELAEKLNKIYKSVTQSNLSRVLKKINAIKKVDKNGLDYYVIEKEAIKLNNTIGSLVFSIDDNNSNIVIKTYDNAAGLIGQIIDDAELEDVMGVISGYNTIIIVPKNVIRIKTLKNEIIRILK